MPDPRVLVNIYFLGIAAVVNVPPNNNVTKAVIFPAAATSVKYANVDLAPHHTWLSVRGLENPDEDCAKVNGTLSGTTMPICAAQLDGARLWVLTSEELLEDATFRKIPSFLKFNPKATDLSDRYLAQDTVDPKYVAARFDIKGGTVSGCGLNKAFVAKIVTKSNDGVLYVQQNRRTVRLILKATGAAVAIENRPDHQMITMTPGEHYGWYYFMNQDQPQDPNVPTIGTSTQPLIAPTATSFSLPAACLASEIPSVGVVGAFASAECTVQNFP